MSGDGKGSKGKNGANHVCPVCGRPRVTKHRPFCSARCTQRDLGHWLQGSYRIPTDEEPGDMDGGTEDGPELEE